MKINVGTKAEKASWEKKMTAEIYKQILEIRNMPNAPDMFDYAKVQRVASSQNLKELVAFIDENKDDYIGAVLFGPK